ncbi:MAG: hypothetical protein HYY21_01010 [Candidatus Tectomicrobia bacterium]|nr:hypothetical protein [Candidatus Tectomicrobia bacterium]
MGFVSARPWKALFPIERRIISSWSVRAVNTGGAAASGFDEAQPYFSKIKAAFGKNFAGERKKILELYIIVII